MDKTLMSWLTLLIFDGGIVLLLRLSLHQVDMRAVLREKALDSQPNPVADIAPGAAASAGAGILPDNTSYSRLAGFIGAVVLACFLWAVGNIIIFDAFNDANVIPSFLGSLGSYFLAGSSLFAPYAFNKLSGIFK